MRCDILDLKVEKPGFRRFLSSWILRDDRKNRTYLVDTGPSATWPVVREAVETWGGGRLDSVLLTHVHLDHAGATALAVKEYGCSVSVSPKGRRHLIDPEDLWKGSVATLGETALLYGKPDPLPEEAILPEGTLPEGFVSVETPGHASHHRSFLCCDGTLFAGEAAGIFLEGEEPFPYLRPATPPRFFPEVTLDSIDRLLGLGAKRICYSHFGAAEGAMEMLTFAKEQILFWKAVILELLRRGASPSEEELFFQELLERDPFLAAWRRMEPDIQDREREFIGNSIQGFLGAFGPVKPEK